MQSSAPGQGTGNAGNRWHTAYMQIVLLGFVYVGIASVYHALNSMAGGVAPERKLFVTKGGVFMHAAMIPASILAPLSINALGVRFNLFLGGIGYFVYILFLFYCGKTGDWPGEWMAFGGAVMGVGAACLWTAMGVIVTSYPTPETKASYFAIFWVIQNAGTVVACLLTFFMDLESPSGAIDTMAVDGSVFVVFMILTVVGTFIPWLMVSEDKVVRPDGSAVPVKERPNVLKDFVLTLQRFLDWRYLALIPLFVCGKYPFVYQFFSFNKLLFTIRTQGLNDVFYFLAQALGSVVIGRFLDRQGSTVRTKGWMCVGMLGIFSVTAWSLGLFANRFYQLDDRLNIQQIDIIDSGFGPWILPLMLYASWGLSDVCIQSFAYWILGQLEDKPEELSRSNGFMQAVQQVGGLIAYLHAYGWHPLDHTKAKPVTASQQCWVNFALVVLMIPGCALAWSSVRERSKTDALVGVSDA